MKKIFILFFFILGANFLFSQNTIQVQAGVDSLDNAVSAAGNGDIIELVTSGGIYTTTNQAITIDKNLIIKAKSGLAEKPVLRSTSTSGTHMIFQIKEGGSLSLQGVIMDGQYPESASPCNYCFRTYTSGNIETVIKFINCEFKNVKQCAIKIYATSIVDTLSITNCIFDSTGQEAILLRQGTGSYPAVKYFDLSNSTFYNIARDAIYAQVTNPDSAVFKINHCTFDRLDNVDYRPMINTTDIKNVDIKNSIFSNQLSGDSISVALFGNSKMDYCDLWNVGQVTTDSGATLGAGMLNADPQYTDTTTANYILKSSSPVLGKADDGEAMGDLRWVNVNAPNIIEVQAGVDSLDAAVSNAKDGDIIELTTSGGEYITTNYAITIDKKLTIRAKSGLASKPVLLSSSTSGTNMIFQIKAGGALNLQGVVMNGQYPASTTTCNYCLRTYTSGNIETVININDCEFKNVQQCAIKIYATSVVDTMNIANCTFDSTGQEAILLRQGTNSYPAVKYFNLSNCTFYSIGRDALYAQLTNSDSAVFMINHCTFDRLSNADDRPMINTTDVRNVAIKNSIFSNQLGNDTVAVALFGNSTMEYCDLWNVAHVTADSGATIGAGMLNADPQYTDTSLADYQLRYSSPVLGKADDGKAMGDLRWANITGPKVYEVAAGENTIGAAVSTANDGDVIELTTSGGIYTNSSSAISIDKKLTIRAKNGLAKKPILQSTSTASTHEILQVKEGGSLTLQGVIMDGQSNEIANPAKYCFRTYTSGAIETVLKFDNCVFENVLENAIKIYSTSTVDTLMLTNCTFDSTGKEAMLLREGTGLYPNVKFLDLANCTFYGIAREAIYAQLTNPDSAVFKINHCTFDRISYSEGDPVLNTTEVKNVEIKNSIFSNQLGNDSVAVTLFGNSSMQYCDLWNVGSVTTDSGATVGAGMLNADPQYTDTSTANYLLESTSPLLGKADDGEAMGDLRWNNTPTGIQKETEQPMTFNLSQNYPNPFNPSTTINYTVPKATLVVLKIYNILGQEVATLVNTEKPAGKYSVQFNSSNLISGSRSLASGIYIYRIQAGSYSASRKMILLK